MLMKILYRCLMVIPLLLAGTMAAQAVTMSEVESRLLEAEQLRAAEFSPSHYAEAKELLADAREELASGDNDDAREALDSSADHLKLAVEATQKMMKQFSALIESRDRMQMTESMYLRKDLAERAERLFDGVVEAVEDGDVRKAKSLAKHVASAIRDAQMVALKKQYDVPVSKNVAKARSMKARDYSPKAFKALVTAQKKVKKLIKKSPDAQVKMHAITESGQHKAERAIRIAQLGVKLRKEPALIEALVDAEEARLQRISKPLDIDLSLARDAAAQEKLILEALVLMKKNGQQRLQDADKTIATLSGKLAKYEGKFSKYQSDLANMAELRKKLQNKRDAEAKIKRLAKLFNANDVEILLTPNADVILRMKSLNFRSGSAVIAPKSYRMIDGTAQAMAMFSKREVRIEGHTDSVGSSLYNQKLSERRADSVKAYLVEKTSGKRKIKVVGFGEQKPIANNQTRQGREQNRRIDVVLLSPKL